MRTVTIPQQNIIEDIVSIENNYNGFVRVIVGNGTIVNDKFELLPNQNLSVFMITDDPGIIDGENIIKPAKLYYTDLMSANPTWAPNKPANTFRKEDLWHFVDLLRQA